MDLDGSASGASVSSVLRTALIACQDAEDATRKSARLHYIDTYLNMCIFLRIRIINRRDTGHSTGRVTAHAKH